MTNKKRGLRAAAVSVLVVPGLLLGPSADAASFTWRDNKGDAPKAVDVVKWSGQNGKKRFGVKLRYRKLRFKRLNAVGMYVLPKGKKVKNLYVFGYERRKKGANFKPVVRAGKKRIKCKGMKLRRKGKTIRISAPQKCLRKKDRGPQRFAFVSAPPKKKKLDTSKGFSRFVKRG